MSKVEPVYIVFTSRPGPGTGCQFVEVETKEGKGIGITNCGVGVSWEDCPHAPDLSRLGPFVPASAHEAALEKAQALQHESNEEIRALKVRLGEPVESDGGEIRTPWHTRRALRLASGKLLTACRRHDSSMQLLACYQGEVVALDSLLRCMEAQDK